MTDEELITEYAREHPDCLPENNPLLKEQVNDANYVDRGMWGPYGGKGGKISKLWLKEYRDVVLGEDKS